MTIESFKPQLCEIPSVFVWGRGIIMDWHWLACEGRGKVFRSDWWPLSIKFGQRHITTHLKQA